MLLGSAPTWNDSRYAIVGFIKIKLTVVANNPLIVYISAISVHIPVLDQEVLSLRGIFNGALLMDSLLVKDVVNLVYFVSSTIVLSSCAV